MIESEWIMIEIMSLLPPDVVWRLRSVSRGLRCLQEAGFRRMFQRKWNEELTQGWRVGAMPTDAVSWRLLYAGEFATFDSNSLYATFCECGECSPPAAALADLVAPPDMTALLRRASRWHLSKGHHDVFGVNLFFETGPFYPNVERIFGDAELKAEWAAEHASPNCAEAGWECFATLSEYDSLFVCVARGPHFGATRWVTNNCFDDRAFTPAPFSRFLHILAQFANAYREQYRLTPDEVDLCLVHFARTVVRQAAGQNAHKGEESEA
jgi:hypothetical protein